MIARASDRVSSTVWLDAFKAQDGQRPLDFTNEAFRKSAFAAAEKDDASFPPLSGKPGPAWINEQDAGYLVAKATPQPLGTYLQPIRLSGAYEKVAKKTYVRATSSQIRPSTRRSPSARPIRPGARLN